MFHLCWKKKRGNELASDSVPNTHKVQILQEDWRQDEMSCRPVCIMPQRPDWPRYDFVHVWVACRSRAEGANHMPGHMGLQGICSVCPGESKHVWKAHNTPWVNTESGCYWWWHHLINPLHPQRGREGSNSQRLTMYCLAITSLPCCAVLHIIQWSHCGDTHALSIQCTKICSLKLKLQTNNCSRIKISHKTILLHTVQCEKAK